MAGRSEDLTLTLLLTGLVTGDRSIDSQTDRSRLVGPRCKSYVAWAHSGG